MCNKTRVICSFITLLFLSCGNPPPFSSVNGVADSKTGKSSETKKNGGNEKKKNNANKKEDEDDDEDRPDSNHNCKTDNVLICHLPPDNPTSKFEICVGAAAVPDHLSHGDNTGVCK